VRGLFSRKEDQLTLAVQLWLALDHGDRAAPINVLLDSLSSFILTSYDNKALSSGSVQFLAVLGIDAETKRLRRAKNYSYMLARMVYCVRVLGVEKLLPAAGRDEQGDDDRDRFLDMRKKYLADGSYSPMSRLSNKQVKSSRLAGSSGA
jgi:hypothetical protein